MVIRVLLYAALAAAMFAAPTRAEFSAQQEEQLSDWWRTCESTQADLDDVIKTCTSIIDSGLDTRQNRAVAYSNRGDALREKGEFERALADHTEALKLDPFSSALHDNFGRLLADMGEFDRAIVAHSEAIRLDSNDAIAHDNRGFAWQAKGDYERAIADYSAAIKLNPDDGLAYANRARARLYTGAPHRSLGRHYPGKCAGRARCPSRPMGGIITHRNKASKKHNWKHHTKRPSDSHHFD